MPIIVNARNFTQEVLQASGPVLVEFYGDQCMPCRLLRPVLMELSQQYPVLKVCMFSTDRQPDESDEEYEEMFGILATFSVMNLPTMLLFVGGELLGSMIGLHSLEELLEIFRAHGLILTESAEPEE